MKAQASSLIPRIRELMRQRMRAGIEDAIRSMQDNMLESSRASQTAEDHQLVLQTLDLVHRDKRRLVENFEARLLALYDEKLGWLRDGGRQGGEPRAFGQFDLLDDQVFAQQVALKKLVQKTLEEIDKTDLVCVEVRLNELFEVPIDGVRNPVGPGTALKAAQHACSTACADDQAVQSALMNALQPHLAAGLTGFYRELNDVLLSAGLRPDYRPAIERDTSNRVARHPADSGMSVSQVMSLRDLLPGRTSSPLDLTEIFAALMAGTPAHREYGARVLADEEHSLYAGAMDMPVREQLLESLHAMQHAPQANAEASALELRAVVAEMASAGEHPLDQLTGELVGVVFDFLLGDRKLPDTVKSELARMQIVALKAALLDRSFFARREHPLRALLDEIVRVGSDPTLDTQPDSYFLNGLKQVIDEVIAAFETDLQLFDVATAKLRDIVAEAAAESEQSLAEMTASLMAEERLAHVRTIAMEAMAKRVRPDAPPFVRAFLRETWPLALAEARINAAGDDELWDERMRLADALQDSVRPRLRHELPPFVATLPGLVRAVQDGIRAAGMPSEAARAFMDELMAAHTAVLQLRMAPVPTQATSATQLVVAVDSDMFSFQQSSAAVLLQRGDVVELANGDAPQSAKLLWVSPGRSRYLFGVAGGGAHAMTGDEVANALANGQVRVVQTGDVLDRAFASFNASASTRH